MVPYIHEPQATQVSVPVHPAAYCDVFTDICLCHITSSMTPGRPAHWAVQGMRRVASICIKLLYVCCYCLAPVYALMRLSMPCPL